MNKIFLGLLFVAALLYGFVCYGQEIQPGAIVHLFGGCLILDDLHNLDEIIAHQNDQELKEFLNDQENTCGIVDHRIPFEVVKKMDNYVTKDGSSYTIYQFKGTDGKPFFASNKDDSGKSL